MPCLLSAAGLPDLELPALLAAADESGCDGVELFRDRTASSVAHPQYSVRRLRETLAAAGKALGAYEIRALTGRKADSDERNLAYNLRQLEWDIHLGRALGVRAFGLRGGQRTDEARQDLVAGVNDLLERLPGIHLLLGPQPGSPLQDATDFDELMPQLSEGVRVLLDAGPLRASGQDPAALAAAWDSRLGLVRLQADDAGDGDARLLEVLAGFAGPLVIEASSAASAAALRERLTAAVG